MINTPGVAKHNSNAKKNMATTPPEGLCFNVEEERA